MRPVPPGWVVVPANTLNGNEWYHLVGWTETEHPDPVIATPTGVSTWAHFAGTDPYCVATLKEWTGE